MNKTLLIVLGLVAAGAAAFFFWNKSKQAPTVATAPKAPIPAGDNTVAYLNAGTQLLDTVLSKFGQGGN